MNNDTQQMLERHFDTAFAAPDGIKKLRELILTLAMQGKLVAQDPNDPPASKLLKEIEAEKQQLVKVGKIKKPKALPEIKQEEVPYELPVGWAWVRLGELIELVSGQHLTPNEYNDEKIGFSYYTGPADFGAQSPNATRWTNVYRAIAMSGDILLTVKGAGVGKTNVLVEEKAAISRQLMALRVILVNRDFVLRFLGTIFYELQALAVGIAIPGIGRDDVLMRKFPLPPLPEQHRIVAKIDQLMTRCDELEKLRTEREQMRLAVHTAAIQQLLDAEVQDSHARAWQFLTQHFEDLYAVKENVSDLRKAILQLAVMGKLVPQHSNDPPASELLKQIEAEKQRLVNAGKSKKTKPLLPIKQEEVPYQLPQGWEWVRLVDLGITQTGTTPPSKDRENYGDHIPFIGPGDITNGRIDFSGEGLSEIGLFKGRLIDANSVLMVCIGGSIGKHAINERDITCNQQINTLTPYCPIPVKYVYGVMAAVYFQNAVINQAGGSATPIINKQKWSAIPIPIPPLPEQQRIVARIDQLMALCDTLEQQIESATNKRAELLNSVMAQV